jgi:hypothetical protein
MTSHARRIAKLAPAALLLALVLPSAAFGQATRTWVSGTGDDVNPCSRTAPCRTFAGAYSKTADGGEINALDPGGYGTLNIDHSITIDGSETLAGVLSSLTNGFSINAAATDRVVLRNLDINGAGNGLNGIRVLQAKSVSVYDTRIYGVTRNAFDFEPTNSNAKALLHNVSLENNTGNGVLVAPPAGVTNASVSVRYSTISSNGCGLVVTNHLPDPGFAYSANCGTQLAAVGGSGKISAYHNSVIDHDAFPGAAGSTAVFTNGQQSVIRIGLNEINGNVNGLRSIDVGLGGIYSFVNNFITGNNTNGSPNGTISPT